MCLRKSPTRTPALLAVIHFTQATTISCGQDASKEHKGYAQSSVNSLTR